MRAWTEEKEGKERSPGVAAFFDLDGTLLARPSLERRFLKVLQYRREIRVESYFLWLREAARLASRGIGAILLANKMYLRGVRSLEERGSGGLGWSPWRKSGHQAPGQAGAPLRRNPRLPVPVFFEGALEKLAWHGRQRHVIVLLSGTLAPLATDVAQTLEAVLAEREVYSAIRVVATRLEEVDGRWTGKILGEAMFGEAKARAARWIAPELSLDLAQCYAYGDSARDRWLLAAVGRPVAVNPSRKLEGIARRQKWQVVRWELERRETTARSARRARTGAGAREIAEKVCANCNSGSSAGKIGSEG